MSTPRSKLCCSRVTSIIRSLSLAKGFAVASSKDGVLINTSLELSATDESSGNFNDCPLTDSPNWETNKSDSKLASCNQSLIVLGGIAVLRNIKICSDVLSPLSPRLDEACAM